MGQKTKTLQSEVLEKLKDVRKKIEEFIDLIEKYGIDDPDINSDLYFFAREYLLKLVECIFRATTTNPKFETLFAVLRDIILPAGNEYDLLDDFVVMVVLSNYKKMINIHMESNVAGDIEFQILEREHSDEKLSEIYSTIREAFRYGRDITNQ